MNSQAHLENGTYEKIVSPFENELERKGLQAPDELQINTVTQQATQQNPKKPKPNCQPTAKNHVKTEISAPLNWENLTQLRERPGPKQPK